MKTRAELYGREAAMLLRDITMYHVLTKQQLLRLYPMQQEKIEKLLSYLTKQGRIYQASGLYCASPECAEHIDYGLLNAVWVLSDFIDRIEYHSIGDYPTKIIFFADGEVYEIIHAAEGKEALLSNILPAPGDPTSKYLVLIDNPAQIEQLHFPHISGYCNVSPTGEVEYYQTE